MAFGLRRAKVLGKVPVQLVSKISNLCDPDRPTLQTDGRTSCNRNTALCTKVHRMVKIDIPKFVDGGPEHI